MLGIAVALFAVAVSLLNASWLAPNPRGKLMLVAHRGVAQQFSREGIGEEACTAARSLPSGHNYIENSIRSIEQAVRLGADAIELDVQPTKDGRMVVFHDSTLECRTDGTGPVRDRTLAELKALDIGHGYTADGGETFPLRGRGVGAMPTVEEVLERLPRVPFIFHLKTREEGDADLLLAAFARAGIRFGGHYAFYGNPAMVRRIEEKAPDAWTFSKQAARRCLLDYLRVGWTGIVPLECRNATVVVPLNYQWAIWGWPNRFLDRMAKANTRVILMGDYKDGIPAGIERPEQLARVPRSYRGYLWVEDIYTIGPALKQWTVGPRPR